MKEYIIEIRKIIPENICKKIIAYFDNDLSDARIADENNPFNKNIRNCKISHLQRREKTSFGQKIILNYLESVIFTAAGEFQKIHEFIKLGEINQLDLLKYESNEHKVGYDYHTDASFIAPNRTLSLSICLNNKFEGGEFSFYLPDGKEYVYPQNVGDLIMFPSSFMFPHKVNRITKGTRYALISWIS